MAKCNFERIGRWFSAICFGVILIASAASAESIDLNNVPKDKADQIRQLATSAQPSETDKAISIASESVNKYVELGTAMGAAIKSTANELGVEPKEFANSPLGYASYFWLAWELWLGQTANTLSNVLIGAIWLFFFISVWSFYFRKICLEKETVYEEIERPILDAAGADTGKFEKVKQKTIRLHDINDGTVAGYRLVFFIVLIIIGIPGLVFIS